METFVSTGQVKVIFWPVINHGNPSLYASAATDCVAQQDAALAWEIHHTLFENQNELWSASRDYFVEQAVAVGADQAAFETCYDEQIGVDNVLTLDAIRRERGIYEQPVFEVNDQRTFGEYSLVEMITAALAAGQ